MDEKKYVISWVKRDKKKSVFGNILYTFKDCDIECGRLNRLYTEFTHYPIDIKHKKRILEIRKLDIPGE